MNKRNLQIALFIIAILAGFGLGYTQHHILHQQLYSIEEEEVILVPEHPFYLMEEVNEEILYKTLVHYQFPEPAIITAQAVLETGHFKSRLFLDGYNMFGLYNSTYNEYFRFDSWISCVFAYKKYILNKYKDGEPYYDFINRIGYASDPGYIAKVKQLEKKIKEKYEIRNGNATNSKSGNN